MADTKRLFVVINGHGVGEVVQDGYGQMTFTYSESWRSSRSATPLSLSLSLVQARHGQRAVDPFLRGLLPDNQEVLDRWARRYGVSANNPFALLTHVGEDVAGAAQFVRESRLVESQDPGMIEEVSEDYIEERLRTLREDRASWTDTRGEFSLAGAQSKFALYRAPDGSWGIPHGRKATTHIFKPPLPGLADQEVNEHLCLQAASLLGMRTAISEVGTFGSEQAIVLERYDRFVGPDGDVTRVHQEDICQALGVSPDRKYERGDGGPGATRVIELFREHQTPAQADESVWRAFAEAVSIDPDEMVGWVYDVVSNAPDAFRDAVAQEPEWVRQLATTKTLVAGVATSVAERLLYLSGPRTIAGAVPTTNAPASIAPARPPGHQPRRDDERFTSEQTGEVRVDLEDLGED